MSNVENPLVSVCIIAYNHANYIDQCIQSVLGQQTDFEFEIVIGDDHSRDGTVEICERYADLYPGRIKLIKRPVNLGITQNWMETIKACTGKYIALCEGDDYWAVSTKLQEQVMFLEANEDFALSFHDAEIVNERDPGSPFKKYSDYDWNRLDPKKELYSLSDLLAATLCPSASVVFRKPENFKFPDWFTKLPFADMSLFILVTGQKKIGYINEAWSVYRRHDSSASAAPLAAERFIKGRIEMYLHLYPGLSASQQKMSLAIVGRLINSIAGLKVLSPETRKLIKELMPGFYWQKFFAFNKKNGVDLPK